MAKQSDRSLLVLLVEVAVGGWALILMITSLMWMARFLTT